MIRERTVFDAQEERGVCVRGREYERAGFTQPTAAAQEW